MTEACVTCQLGSCGTKEEFLKAVGENVAVAWFAPRGFGARTALLEIAAKTTDTGADVFFVTRHPEDARSLVVANPKFFHIVPTSETIDVPADSVLLVDFCNPKIRSYPRRTYAVGLASSVLYGIHVGIEDVSRALSKYQVA